MGQRAFKANAVAFEFGESRLGNVGILLPLIMELSRPDVCNFKRVWLVARSACLTHHSVGNPKEKFRDCVTSETLISGDSALSRFYG